MSVQQNKQIKIHRSRKKTNENKKILPNNNTNAEIVWEKKKDSS